MKISKFHPDKVSDKVYFLPFNRPVKPSGVKALEESIERHGVIRPVTLVKTDVLDGTNTLYVADGQHLMTALLNLNMHVPYVTLTVNNREDLFSLVAELNTTAVSWKTVDYVRLWASSGNKHYIELQDQHANTDLSFAQISVCLTGSRRGMDSIKHGNFRITNKSFGNEIISEVNKLNTVLHFNSDIVFAYYKFRQARRQEFKKIDFENFKNTVTHFPELVEVHYGTSKSEYYKELFHNALLKVKS